MQTSNNLKLAHWYAAQGLFAPISASEKHIPNSCNPLKAMLVQFHRLSLLLLLTLMVLSVGIRLVMRVIYPQPLPHLDDMTGYEVLMPGTIVDPEDFGLSKSPFSFHPSELLPGVIVDSEDFGLRLSAHSLYPAELNLDILQTNTYISIADLPQIVAINIPYQEKIIRQFTLYSKTLRFLDLLWRWGRPTSTEKDIPNKHWDIVWRTDSLTISVFIQRLNINTAVSGVWIVLN